VSNGVPPCVLHVITGLGNGGAEGVLSRLVTATRDEALQSVVVSLTAGGTHRDALARSDCAVFDLGMQRGRANPSALWRLASLIRQFRPIAIQSWMYHADLLSTMALSLSGLARRTRLYWGIRCSDMQAEHYSVGFRLVRRSCALLSRAADGIVANSYAGRDVHTALGYSSRNFSVIPNGIDVQQFKPDAFLRRKLRAELGLSDARVVAITAARVDPMKGFEILGEAARRLPDMDFIVAGAGTDALTFPPNVRALGHRSDIADLLPAADVLLSTSLFGEGFSNAIAEGMAAGLCPVVSDVGDARHIANSLAAVYPAGNVPALVRSLKALLDEDAQAIRARGLAARERVVQSFSVERMVHTFDALHLHASVPEA
jgi:glycosyltransferase involved in cell wall biosynthesis